MKKKSFGRFTAIGLAAITAVPAISIVASAANVPSSLYLFGYNQQYDNSSGGLAISSSAADAIKAKTINWKVQSTAPGAAAGATQDYGNTLVSAALSTYTNVSAATSIAVKDWATELIGTDTNGNTLNNKYALSNLVGLTDSDVLVFNSQSNMNSAMSAIKSSEQAVLTKQLDVIKKAIDSEIAEQTRLRNLETSHTSGWWTAQEAINELNAVKNAMSYTYKDTDLFTDGDGIDSTPTYAVATLTHSTSSTTGGTTSQLTTVNNSSQFSSLVSWSSSTNHLNVSNTGNNSWWYATKAGNAINGNGLWFTGLMSEATTEIANGAFAGYWEQYDGKGTTSSNNNNNNNNNNNDTTTYLEPSSTYRYASSNNVSYLANNGFYYPNLDALYSVGFSTYSTKSISSSYTYDSSRTYFCAADGNYYSTATAARNASTSVFGTGYDSYWYTVTGKDNYGSVTVYYNSGTGKWYTSYSEAMYASSYGSVSSKTVTSNAYFSRTTGLFYSTYSTALSASSSSSDVITYNGTTTDNTNTLDPYFNYFLQQQLLQQQQNNKNNNTTSSTGEPTLASNSRISGWNAILNQLNSNSSGSTINVSMNEATTVTQSVISAARTSGKTLRMTLSNGVVWSIKGSSISSAKTLNLNTKYNTKNIPTSLVNKAVSLNTAVSKAQISIGDNASFGLTADVTVKFSSNRAGRTVKLYRYNSQKNSLSLASTARIQSNGSATFSISTGGDFIAVVC